MWWGGGGGGGEDAKDGSGSGAASASASDETSASATGAASSSGSTPVDLEVMEILSEEDLQTEASSRGEEEEDADEEDFARLRASFRQQEDLLGELTGALRRNQDKLHGRELEVQVCVMVKLCGKWMCFMDLFQNYAVRLANARSRRKEREAEEETSSHTGASSQPPQTTTPIPVAAAGGSGKIRLLRKQLEEANVSFQHS